MSTSIKTRIKWSPVATAFVIAQHEANKLNAEVTENSLEALAAIGVAVASHVEHKGELPTAHAIRSKLSSATKMQKSGEPIYVPATTVKKPSAAGDVPITTKPLKVVKLTTHLGIEASCNTLVNANAGDLDHLIKAVVQLKSLSILNCTREQLEDQLEIVLEEEQDALAAGVTAEELASIESDVSELVDSTINPE